MRGQTAGLVALGAALMSATPAQAGIDELHVGVMQHNACVLDCKNAFKEGEPNIEVEVSFNSPEWLNWIGSPRPSLMASVNTQGDTSFGGFGLQWRWQFAENWTIEPGVGYVVHNGELENAYPNGTPRSDGVLRRACACSARAISSALRSASHATCKARGPCRASTNI